MCGRIALYTPPQRLARAFAARLGDDVDPGAAPRWNVGPTSQVLALTARAPTTDTGLELVLDQFRWGLVPSWATGTAIGSRLFNARAETADTKPSFRTAFRNRRAAVVADGFMEWQQGPRGHQPFFFRREDGAPLAFAGLWERWIDPQRGPDGFALRSCTIITTAAGPDVAPVHDRMPVVLEAEALDRWLDPANTDISGLKSLLHPGAAGVLTRYPIDRRAGNVRNDDPSVIEPVDLVDPRTVIGPGAT